MKQDEFLKWLESEAQKMTTVTYGSAILNVIDRYQSHLKKRVIQFAGMAKSTRCITWESGLLSDHSSLNKTGYERGKKYTVTIAEGGQDE